MARNASGAISRVVAGVLRVRWLVRAPIWLYRARLGILLGPRMLMLEHRGRKSGRRRYVALEVVDHPAPERYVVVSGFGERAQWLRNITAEPRVRVYTGSRVPRAAVAHRLAADEAARTLARYAAAHPRSWNKLRPVLEETLGISIDERATGVDLPVIALDAGEYLPC